VIERCAYHEWCRAGHKKAVRQPLGDMSGLGSTAAEESNQSCLVHGVQLGSEIQYPRMDRSPLKAGSVGSQKINDKAYCGKISSIIGANRVNGRI